MFGIGKVKLLLTLGIVLAIILAVAVASTRIYNAGYAAGEDAAFASVEAANKEGIDNAEALVRARRDCRAAGRSWSVVTGVCS